MRLPGESSYEVYGGGASGPQREAVGAHNDAVDSWNIVDGQIDLVIHALDSDGSPDSKLIANSLMPVKAVIIDKTLVHHANAITSQRNALKAASNMEDDWDYAATRDYSDKAEKHANSAATSAALVHQLISDLAAEDDQ